ncbi:hypothetical protein ACE38W_03815 [Chitinophaga sp. Hz27]|uniref:hypothetical protein n=1 Tax=Chitinophaga sp. Hz27 TaxID=3347169 RepID=UPI0035E20229
MKVLIVIILLILPAYLEAQISQQHVVSVLEENIVGKKITYKEKYGNTAEFTYLGILRSKTGEIYKVMKVNSLSGLYKDSQRSWGGILVFNRNNLLGYYYVGSELSLPSYIKKNELIFKPSEGCTETTVINFYNGIPASIFILCDKKGGDAWTFYEKNKFD